MEQVRNIGAAGCHEVQSNRFYSRVWRRKLRVGDGSLWCGYLQFSSYRRSPGGQSKRQSQRGLGLVCYRQGSQSRVDFLGGVVYWEGRVYLGSGLRTLQGRSRWAERQLLVWGQYFLGVYLFWKLSSSLGSLNSRQSRGVYLQRGQSYLWRSSGWRRQLRGGFSSLPSLTQLGSTYSTLLQSTWLRVPAVFFLLAERKISSLAICRLQSGLVYFMTLGLQGLGVSMTFQRCRRNSSRSRSFSLRFSSMVLRLWPVLLGFSMVYCASRSVSALRRFQLKPSTKRSRLQRQSVSSTLSRQYMERLMQLQKVMRQLTGRLPDSYLMTVLGIEKMPYSQITPFIALSMVLSPMSFSWFYLLKYPTPRMLYTLPVCLKVNPGYSTGSILIPSPSPLRPKKYSFRPLFSLIMNSKICSYLKAKYCSRNSRQCRWLASTSEPFLSRFRMRVMQARLSRSLRWEYSQSASTLASISSVLSISSMILRSGMTAAILSIWPFRRGRANVTSFTWSFASQYVHTCSGFLKAIWPAKTRPVGKKMRAGPLTCPATHSATQNRKFLSTRIPTPSGSWFFVWPWYRPFRKSITGYILHSNITRFNLTTNRHSCQPPTHIAPLLPIRPHTTSQGLIRPNKTVALQQPHKSLSAWLSSRPPSVTATKFGLGRRRCPISTRW